MLALVTGAASGFGLAFVKQLRAAGATVIGVDQRPIEAWPLLPDDAIVGDVTDDDTLARAVATAERRGGITLFVNNAGYGLFNTIEEADPAAVERLVAVNLLAPGRWLQALLPQLRACSGAVVQTSSVAGRMVFPESGWYAATKFALEALSEALAVETADDGVRVRVVEPGRYDTGFGAVATAVSAPRIPGSDYADRQARWDGVKDGMLAPPQDPAEVARTVLATLHDPRLFMRVPMGLDARTLLEHRDQTSPDGWVAEMIERFGA